jgi:hypothetical protein
LGKSREQVQSVLDERHSKFTIIQDFFVGFVQAGFGDLAKLYVQDFQTTAQRPQLRPIQTIFVKNSNSSWFPLAVTRN